MFRDFPHYIAWTDTVYSESGFAGLIGYQRKAANSTAHILWVVGPHIKSEQQAEASADLMLNEISNITRFGKVIYRDGVML